MDASRTSKAGWTISNPNPPRSQEHWDVVVVGAGAAGLFAALQCKELSPKLSVLIVDAGPKPLKKVRISGGGRCNVTHDCHDLDDLLACYPRGGHRLETILGRFMPADTIDWFQSRGVKLKVESDGRMFPVSNTSQTIVDCLLGEAKKLDVELRSQVRVTGLKGRAGEFTLSTKTEDLQAKKVLLATGGASKATEWLQAYGHQPIADIPSLFTFCVQHPVLQDLPGLSVNDVALSLQTETNYESRGPWLITHWGLSGPAVLKLSAFAARALFETDYRAQLRCDFLPTLEPEELDDKLANLISGKQISTNCPFPEIPKRLWKRLTAQAGIGESQCWKQLKPQRRQHLIEALKDLSLDITGKGVFKEEFVTSGGVPLHEIDVYTMESRKVPGIYVAGELLNVDGITGGFNFQNAWATGSIAGIGMS